MNPHEFAVINTLISLITEPDCSTVGTRNKAKFNQHRIIASPFLIVRIKFFNKIKLR